MIVLPLLLFGQIMMHVPVTKVDLPPDPSRPHSIVVATTVKQTDPRPIDCGSPPCTSWFKAEFDKAETIAGPVLPATFVADQDGLALQQPYELVWIVEHRADGTLLINDAVGFYPKSGEACFGPEITPCFPPLSPFHA